MTSGDKDGDAATFLHQHVLDTVVILEVGNLLHPRCPQCDMLVPWSTLKRRHFATTH